MKSLLGEDRRRGSLLRDVVRRLTVKVIDRLWCFQERRKVNDAGQLASLAVGLDVPSQNVPEPQLEVENPLKEQVVVELFTEMSIATH